MPKQEQIKKPRGHLKEKIERNQALISLYICGFNTYQISDLLKVDRRNTQRFIHKYFPKYLESILEKEVKFLTNKILNNNGKPKRNKI